jgi:hypothetical protein
LNKRILDAAGSLVGALNGNLTMPVKELAKVLIVLSTGDGEKLTGAGIEENGRVIMPEGLHRLAEEGTESLSQEAGSIPVARE